MPSHPGSVDAKKNVKRKKGLKKALSAPAAKAAAKMATRKKVLTDLLGK
ncbi:hypothetical protein LCGC14_2569660 [marine sediment metagenome]|uniref:Uncharacterized protein n=1 Tax=marine sediment metagenome TaxID=412755 RepID=A0A0F9DAH9_9ZZZZ